MTRPGPRDLENFLSAYGWSYEPVMRHAWVTGWEGSYGTYPLEIRLTETFVSFTVKPLLGLTIDWDEFPEILRHILELNQGLQIAKLGLDGAGWLSLSCQVPAEGFGYQTMDRILGILGYYADEVVFRLTERLRGLGLMAPAPNPS